ncbi:Octopamine receptor [Orchesella cincta]|uniref:Octopamine receptor n=1 Tax=Orchesella cincta TaxID=48709 RepID=A0A1D2M8J0_ORCCI|nr:Octopamine receptor [Orchesella cincta]
MTNSSSIDPWQTWEILVTTIPMSLLILEIVLGNLLVIIAVLTQRTLRTPSNVIILSLAVADLAVGIFILPLNIADMIIGWQLGKVICRIWLTSDVTLCSTSILHISAIAVDRFRSINEGVSYAQSRTIRMSLIVCGALWLIALWIASAPVLGWNDWSKSGGNASSDSMDCYLTRDLGYIIHSASGAFFIPAAIMVGLYFRIFLLIRNKLRERAKIACVSKSKSNNQPDEEEIMDRHEQSSGDIVEDPSTDATKESTQKPKTSLDSNTTISTNNNDKKTRKKHSEQIETILKNKLRFSLTKERKAAKTLGIIIGAFIVCWTPFTLCYLISGIPGNNVPFVLFQSVTWLGYVNSGLNPIIYTIYNPDFRRAFAVILNCFSCSKHF